MRCRHQADVDAVGPTAAETLKLLLLQDPKQLRLQGKGNIPYFIQEQCPCVSHFEAANFLSDSPSEGTPLVPEKFAFQQVKGNGRAIELYERTPASWAAMVNRAGDQLLTRTGLSEYQHGGIGRCHSFHFREYGFQRGTVAYDFFKSTLNAALFT
jgi:hypothetical protein